MHMQTTSKGMVLLSHVSPANDTTVTQNDWEILEEKVKDWGLHLSLQWRDTSEGTKYIHIKMYLVDKCMAEQMVLSEGLSLIYPRIFHESFMEWWESNTQKSGRETEDCFANILRRVLIQGQD